MIKEHCHTPFMIAKDHPELLAEHHTGKLHLKNLILQKPRNNLT